MMMIFDIYNWNSKWRRCRPLLEVSYYTGHDIIIPLLKNYVPLLKDYIPGMKIKLTGIYRECRVYNYLTQQNYGINLSKNGIV